MRMLVIGGLLIGLLTLSSQACAKGPPNRAEVGRIITEEFKHPGYARLDGLRLSYATKDREGQETFATSDEQQKRCLLALLTAGLVSEPTFAGTGPLTPYREGFIWTSSLTEAGRQFVRSIAENKLEEGAARPTARVVLATPELVAVTGITEPSDASYGPPVVEAQLSYRWNLTPFAHAYSTETWGCLEHGVPTDPQDATVVFTKYDDGWRPGALKGPYGQELKTSE